MGDRVRDLITNWRKNIQSGELPGVVVLAGESDTLLKRALSLLVEQTFQCGGKALNFQTFDGRSTRPAAWLVAARTSPMLAAGRLVHVTDATEVLTSAKALTDDEKKALLVFADNPRKGRIVMSGASVNQQLAWCRELAGINGLHLFETFAHQHDVNSFIRNLFQRRGIAIDTAAVSFLADALGRSTEAIISEVDKLSEYAEESRTVTLGDAQEMVQRLQGHELYELNRALVQKDQVRSLTILDRMFRNLLTTRKKISRSGLPLIVLSTCIESEFRKLSLAKKFAPTNDLDGLASAIKVRNKHVAGIIFNNARRFSEEELENILIEIRHVDKRLKSTRLPAKLMLEELIMTICAPRAKVQKSQLQPL